MIDYNVMRFYVVVYDVFVVVVVEGFEEFVNVVVDVDVDKFGVEGLEVGVVDKFEDE